MRCKGLLFKQCKVGIANGDDAHWKAVTEGHTCCLETYGMSEGADHSNSDISQIIRGIWRIVPDGRASFDGCGDFHAGAVFPHI